jgi:hypothetical protein
VRFCLYCYAFFIRSISSARPYGPASSTFMWVSWSVLYLLLIQILLLRSTFTINGMSPSKNQICSTPFMSGVVKRAASCFPLVDAAPLRCVFLHYSTRSWINPSWSTSSGSESKLFTYTPGFQVQVRQPIFYQLDTDATCNPILSAGSTLSLAPIPSFLSKSSSSRSFSHTITKPSTTITSSGRSIIHSHQKSRSISGSSTIVSIRRWALQQ